MSLPNSRLKTQHSNKIDLPSDTSRKLGILKPSSFLTSWQNYPVWFNDFLNDSQNSESVILMITILLEQTDANQNKPKGERHRAKPGRVPGVKFPSSPCGPAYTALPAVWRETVHRMFPKLCHPEFIVDFHYLGTIDWIIGYTVEINLQSPSPARGSSYHYHMTQSSNTLTTWLVFLAQLVSPWVISLGANHESPL